MGIEQYGRSYKLTVAPVDGGEGITIKDLRVSFRVEKTSTSEPNKATIQVYNLSSLSRGRIETKTQAVVLDAGWVDLSQRIFAGVISRVEHRKEPPDIITEIECKDGRDLSAAAFRRSYRKGTSKRRIVNDVIAAMANTSTGPMTASALAGNAGGRVVLSGKSRQVLDRLARSWGFEWSVQDGAIQIIDETSTSKPKTEAIILRKDTGMIGSPAKTNRGCKVKALLQPGLNPGVYVQVVSTFLSGYFKVESVEHAGDTHGGDWSSNVEARRI